MILVWVFFRTVPLDTKVFSISNMIYYFAGKADQRVTVILKKIRGNHVVRTDNFKFQSLLELLLFNSL